MFFERINTHEDNELQDEVSLRKLLKADLIVLCQERGLKTDGTKADLLNHLLSWKQKTKPVPAPSSPKLFSVDFETAKKSGLMEWDSIASKKSNQDLKNIPSQWFENMNNNDELNQVDLKLLTIGKKLGSGGFKDCYKGTYKDQKVAVGIIKVTNFTKEEYVEIKHEIDVLKQLRHENIVRFIGVCFQNTNNSSDHNNLDIVNKATQSNTSSKFCILTELCENGDLYDYMNKNKKPSLSEQMLLMYDIALGISYLHTRRPSIIHRDLKSMNILIDNDMRAKINDFGLARIRPRVNTLMHTNCGTPNWQAPEFWTANPSYTEKVDVYSCGLIYWEIMQWANPQYPYPYYKLKEHEIYEKVKYNDLRPPLTNLLKYPKTLLDLIEIMWHKDPLKRPSMNVVLEKLNDLLS